METLKDKVEQVVTKTLIDLLDSQFFTDELYYNLKEQLPNEMENDWIEEKIDNFANNAINKIKRMT